MLVLREVSAWCARRGLVEVLCGVVDVAAAATVVDLGVGVALVGS